MRSFDLFIHNVAFLFVRINEMIENTRKELIKAGVVLFNDNVYLHENWGTTEKIMIDKGILCTAGSCFRMTPLICLFL